MKVLHIETGRNLAGGPQQVITLMKGLQTKGVDSTLLCPEDSAIAEINQDNTFIAGPKFRSFKKIVAVSEAVERSLKRQRVDAEYRMTIHDGIRLQDYEEQYTREHLLTEFGLPENAFVIGNVGRFTENKGQLNLLEAFVLIHNNYPQAHLILFGKGEMLDDLLDFVKSHKLENRVHFAGFRTDMPKWYGALQVVVHTAMLEALSVALLEAGASGVPLVAYNNGGISEVISHMHNGLLVQPGQIDQLADAIQRLLESRTLTGRLAENSKKVCVQNFSAERMVNEYYQLYKDILENKNTMRA